MGYEDAPATKFVATKCAACGRPLVDATSVDTGMGPDCRKRLGYDLDLAPEARDEANKLVFLIAAEQQGPGAIAACNRLRELGFERLADRIEERLARAHIEVEGDSLVLWAPYSADLTAALRRVPGRRFEGHRQPDLGAKAARWRANVCPVGSKEALWRALRVALGGQTASGPKGLFLIS